MTDPRARADLRYGARKLGPQVSMVVLAQLMREELANVFESRAPAIRRAAGAVADAAERLAEELNYPDGAPTTASEAEESLQADDA